MKGRRRCCCYVSGAAASCALTCHGRLDLCVLHGQACTKDGEVSAADSASNHSSLPGSCTASGNQHKGSRSGTQRSLLSNRTTPPPPSFTRLKRRLVIKPRLSMKDPNSLKIDPIPPDMNRCWGRAGRGGGSVKECRRGAPV